MEYFRDVNLWPHVSPVKSAPLGLGFKTMLSSFFHYLEQGGVIIVLILSQEGGSGQQYRSGQREKTQPLLGHGFAPVGSEPHCLDTPAGRDLRRTSGATTTAEIGFKYAAERLREGWSMQ